MTGWIAVPETAQSTTAELAAVEEEIAETHVRRREVKQYLLDLESDRKYLRQLLEFQRS